MMTGIGNAPTVLAIMVINGPGPSAPRIGGQHQHRDIDILVDDVEHLLRRVALADHALRRNRGNAIGAARRAVERLIGVLHGPRRA